LIVLKDGKVVEKGTMEQLQEKYATSKLIIQFNHDTEKYKQLIEQLTTVTAIDIERQLLHVYVTNIEEARQQILQFIIEKGLPLTQFTIGRVSLEEMFMRAVSK